MKKKIIYSIIIFAFLFSIITNFSFATNNTPMQNSVNNMVNRVDNAMDTTGNKIENGTQMVKNGVENAGQTVKGATENATRTVTNETALNPNNQGNTF